LFVPGESPVGPRARDVLLTGGTTDARAQSDDEPPQ